MQGGGGGREENGTELDDFCGGGGEDVVRGLGDGFSREGGRGLF